MYSLITVARLWVRRRPVGAREATNLRIKKTRKRPSFSLRQTQTISRPPTANTRSTFSRAHLDSRPSVSPCLAPKTVFFFRDNPKDIPQAHCTHYITHLPTISPQPQCRCRQKQNKKWTKLFACMACLDNGHVTSWARAQLEWYGGWLTGWLSSQWCNENNEPRS